MLELKKERLYNCYRGIKKIDYPKWEGWNLIEDYKKRGVHVSEIEDEMLNTLFDNFVLLCYFKDLYDK